VTRERIVRAAVRIVFTAVGESGTTLTGLFGIGGRLAEEDRGLGGVDSPVRLGGSVRVFVGPAPIAVSSG
jgi:hypothetical protein